MYVSSAIVMFVSFTQLPRDLQDFLDAAGDEGVVLFSLGSHVNEMETAKAQMFAHGLARLSQRVIWQFSGNLSGIRIGENTKTVTWMPQSQLMGKCGGYVDSERTNWKLRSAHCALQKWSHFTPPNWSHFTPPNRKISGGFIVSAWLYPFRDQCENPGNMKGAHGSSIGCEIPVYTMTM